MKRILLAALLLVWIGLQAAQAGGLSPSAEKEIARPGVVVADVLEVTATVEAVDHPKRILTLRGTKGNTLILRADKAVRNFDQLKKGDVVLAGFVESIAIHMRAIGAPPSAAEARLVSVAPKGAKTGVLLAETFQLTAVVESIDAKARLVTVKEANGSRLLVPVDKGFKHLDRFKKGETIALRITEAIAVKVEKRK